jgi:hypothetical protein
LLSRRIGPPANGVLGIAFNLEQKSVAIIMKNSEIEGTMVR